MPAFLVLPAGQEPNMVPSLAAAAAMGQASSVLPTLAMTAGLIVVFLSIALWRFQREEF